MDATPPGVLQYHHSYAASAEVLDPRHNIPHLNLFPECVSIEKATAYVKKNAGKIPATQINKLNALLKHLQDHDIHDTVAVVEETPAQAEQREAYQTIRDGVSALTAKDCGNVGSGPGMGAWERVNKLKKKLFAYLDACQAKNIAAAIVSESVDKDIAALRDSGIR
jgi:hypothetical protein